MDKLVIDNDIFFAQAISLLKKGRSVTIPVHGYSMMPFIRNLRDSVTLEGAESGTPEGLPRKKVKTGDIVLFRFRDRYLMHRILQIRNGIAEIQGDGVVCSKEHCSLDEIYGIVTCILKDGKKKIDPYSYISGLKLALWNLFSPLRRYLLAIMRRLPYFRDPS